jgi:hypothetical protein
MTARPLAQALAVNRIVFGLNFVVAPVRGVRIWVGEREAKRPAAQVLTRAVGARDVALGAGALLALRSGSDEVARAWMAAHAVADSTDFLATLAERDRLPSATVAFALAVAGVSAGIGAWSALTLGR